MLTKKQQRVERREKVVNEMMAYFNEARQAIAEQYPKEALSTAIERTEDRINHLMKRFPTDRSFYFDVLIDVRDRMMKTAVSL